ncbi:MAG: HD domain-containing protein, partial [Candidatus Bathyarchaeota archaeon]|nr:HD domain-containing protein [Candidatus Bathyarchaeota archaeon]
RDRYEGIDHAEEGAKIARSVLEDLGIPSDIIEKVVYAIRVHRFGASITPGTIEACILQDADRLDALGAIGVARAFAYGGFRSLPMYLPGEKPSAYDPFKLKSTFTHFHEKLLKLKDYMNTETARKIAEDRHRFILIFLERFLDEVEGRV